MIRISYYWSNQIVHSLSVYVSFLQVSSQGKFEEKIEGLALLHKIIVKGIDVDPSIDKWTIGQISELREKSIYLLKLNI